MKKDLIINPLVIQLYDILNRLDKVRKQYNLLGRYNPKNDAIFDFSKYKVLIEELTDISARIASVKKSINLHQKEGGETIKHLLSGNDLYLDLVATHFKLASTRIATVEKNLNAMISSLAVALKKKRVPSRYSFFSRLIFRFIRVKRNLKIILTSIYEVRKVIDTQIILNRGLKNYALNYDQLKKGDVLLFYDLEDFLKDDFLARLISIAQGSRITHTGVISNVKKNKATYISAAALGKRMDIFDLAVPPGRFLFVLRPTLNKLKRKYFLEELDMLNYRIENMVQYYPFGEIESWFATLIGLFQIISIRTIHSSLRVGNLLRTPDKVFCSEMIDDLFKNVGVFLTSRSDNDSMVGPAEIFYSPYLEFVGVLCNKNELKSLEKERLVF
ncbi:MAG: hypothetical protein WC022_01475 [Parcubacteria group bacterium]